MNLIIALALIALVVMGIVSSLISVYNRLVQLNYNVDKSFVNIDILLKQRVDEIPNLVTVVKENGKYEQETLNKLTELRTKYLNSNKIEDKVEVNNQINKSLQHLFAVSENYPTLQATQGFINLQQRVSQIEDMIADRRELYNESVNLFNTGIHQFPDVIFAKMLGYSDKNLLQITQQEKDYNGVQF